jgi:propionyl-CoA carboxylase alpha chain
VVKQELLVNGETVALTVERNDNGQLIGVGDAQAAVKRLAPGLYAVTCDGVRKTAVVARTKSGYLVEIDSVVYDVQEPSEAGFAGGAGDHGGAKDKVFAPMPGKIVKIMVAVGDDVELKQPLVIVEAMKMENQVNAKAKGKVKAVNFKAGDQVDTETAIIELELEG